MSRKKLSISEIFPGLPGRIKQIRKRLGSQDELAKLLGVQKPTISRYESGRVPDAETLKKIADIGNTTVEWLLHGEEKAAEQLREFAPEAYDLRPTVLKVDDLVRALLLSRQYLKAKGLHFTDRQEAELSAYLYEYLSEYHADPGEVVIRRLADLIQRQKQED